MSKDFCGVLFKNKEVVGNRPPYSGSATIDGKEYFMDAWVKEKNGDKFFSFAFKEKNGKAKTVFLDEDSDIPF